MTTPVKHLRSATANKRPTASGMVDGRLAINTASGTPGLYFVDNASGIVKVGPAHVGSSAPNVSPAGSAGNSLGELWVNNSTTIHGLNYYTGSAFVNLTPSGTTSVAGLVELATNAETQTGTDTIRAVTPSGLQSKISDSTSTASSTTIASATAVKAAYDLADAALPKTGGRVTGNLEIGPAGSLSFEGSSDNGFETTFAVVDPTADRTITFPNTTGNVVTTGDSNTVTGTMIAATTITNAEISASAAIALSKLATGALPTGITIASGNIVDGTITNADISASAEIAVSKLADGSARQLLQTDAAGTGVEWTSNVDIPGTLDVTGATVLDGDLTIPDKIIHAGDTNTSIRFPANDTFTIETGGSERARVDTFGRLLMGGISPATVVLHSICTPGRLESDGTYSITTASAANVFVGTDGLFSRSTSSLKYKTDVEDAEIGYSEALIYGSRPVWYRSLSESDPSEYSYWGFIAEEVAEIDPRMVFLGPDGPEGVQYDRYVVHLVNVIQKQQQRLDTLESRIAALEG